MIAPRRHEGLRLVHLADLHLGFRRYQRTTPTGVNQREADVAQTFTAAVDRIIDIAPHIIVIAGDVFHGYRPPNSSVLQATREFLRLRRDLPDTPIVIVAGNHDTPLTKEQSGILDLFAEFGIHVVAGEPRRIFFPELELSVLAVPDAGFARPALSADPAARFNVLLLHGEVQGMLPAWMYGNIRHAEIPSEEIGVEQWDYVALGHYHVYRAIAPNMYYSGSIDYTSTNTWGEVVEERKAGLSGKGFAERDLITGEQTFHPLPAQRPVDLPWIDGAGLLPAEIDDAIRSTIEACDGGIDGKDARLTVRNVSQSIVRDLNRKAIRSYQRRALNLNLGFERPDPMAAASDVPYDYEAESNEMNAEMRLLWGDDASPVAESECSCPIAATMVDFLDSGFGHASDADKAAFMERAQAYLDVTYVSAPADGSMEEAA